MHEPSVSLYLFERILAPNAYNLLIWMNVTIWEYGLINQSCEDFYSEKNNRLLLW